MFFAAFAVAHSGFAYNANDIIATLAGNGTSGYGGDAGPAASAGFVQPTDMAFDAAGNLYVADDANHRIRKVTAAGIISTFAGTGVSGFGGDGGSATAAQLSHPQGLAFDSAGNLFVADAGNNRIRKITSGGTISTFAGTGAAGCSNGTGVPTAATLSNPTGLTFDSSGHLFISDTGNSEIRKVANGVISTFSTTALGMACGINLAGFRGLTSDALGNIYVAASLVEIVYKADATTGVLTAFAGAQSASGGYSGDGGAASAAKLNAPQAVAFDNASGSLFIADANNHRVRQVTPDNIIHTVAGNGTAGNSGDGEISTSAELGTVYGVALNAAHVLFAADSIYAVVREVGPAAPLLVNAVYDGSAPTVDNVVSVDGRIACPGTHCGATYVVGMRVILSTSVSDAGIKGALYQWSGGGCRGNGSCTAIPTTLATTGVTAYFTSLYIDTLVGGTKGPALNAPFGLTFDAENNLYFTQTGNCIVRKLTSAGVLTTFAGDGICGDLGDGIPAIEAQLKNPQGVAVDASGNVYIQDTGNGKIRKVTSDGQLHTFFSALDTTSSSPALAIDSGGNLFALGASNAIIRLTPNGESETFATATSLGFTTLDGLANGVAGGLIAYGSNSDFENNLFDYISARGVSEGGFGSTYEPVFSAGMALDNMGGMYTFTPGCNMTFATLNGSNGSTALVAQVLSGRCDYSGDGGEASNAGADQAVGLAFDNTRTRLYVADTGNNAIRIIYPDAIFTAGFEQ